jgi:ketosteroid isomerase-like protein
MGEEALMSEERRVREANAGFYAAMNSLDIDEMDAVWTNDAKAVCVHPGRGAIIGYEHIRESWEAIFSAASSMSIVASDEQITIAGEIAWVVCTETISLMIESELVAASAQATNIYRCTAVGGKWRMILHHASPVPFKPFEEWPEVIN